MFVFHFKLFSISEDNNTRVLFEKALTNIPTEQTGYVVLFVLVNNYRLVIIVKKSSSEIWRQFSSFETRVGDLSSVLKVEKRRGAVLRNQVR